MAVAGEIEENRDNRFVGVDRRPRRILHVNVGRLQWGSYGVAAAPPAFPAAPPNTGNKLSDVHER